MRQLFQQLSIEIMLKKELLKVERNYTQLTLQNNKVGEKLLKKIQVLIKEN
jgi:hypothetical protein